MSTSTLTSIRSNDHPEGHSETAEGAGVASQDGAVDHPDRAPVLAGPALRADCTRTRGSAMIPRWLKTVLLYGKRPCKRVNRVAGMAQVLATIDAEHAEPQSASTKRAA